jgi:hypothetical protein
VDLMPDAAGDRMYGLEVIGIPGWAGLMGATRIDVAGAIVDHLAVTAQARRGTTGAAVEREPR